MAETQLKLLAFLQASERDGNSFTAADAALAAGLKPASVQTYFSKKLTPRHIIAIPSARGRYMSRDLVDMSAEDFLRLMSQKHSVTAGALQNEVEAADDVQPTYFSRLHLTGLSLVQVIEAYTDWIEGVKEHRSRRSTRLRQGVPSTLDRAALLAGEEIECGEDCILQARLDASEAILRFVHADERLPSSRWWTVVRLTEVHSPQPAVRVEHATGVTQPGSDGPQSTGVPAVLKELLGRKHVGIVERDGAEFQVRNVDAAGLDAYLTYDLFDESRLLPHLVLGVRPGAFEAIDIARLAGTLGTQVIVVRLGLEQLSRFERTFAARGFPAELGLLEQGGVRLYHPNIREARDPKNHPRWIPAQVQAFAPRNPQRAADKLASLVAARVVWRALPQQFFSAVSEWDRQKRRIALLQYLADSSRRSETTQHVRQLREENEELRRALEALQNERSFLEAERAKLDSKSRTLRQEAEDFEALLRIAESERDAIVGERDAAQQEKHNLAATLASLRNAREHDVAFSIDTRDALVSLLLPHDLPGALSIIDTLFPDRVTVLPSAHQSADEAKGFLHFRRAFELMVILVTRYWSAFQSGGDVAARECFGRETYAAMESESVMARVRAKHLRTFEYNGEVRTMWRHLKIGNKDSISETWRLHFDVDTTTGRIVIGHCGRHLDHS